MRTLARPRSPMSASAPLRRSLVVAAPTALLLLLAPAVPAFAGTAERQANCEALGGTFTAGGSVKNPNPNADRCVVTTTVTSAPVPSGTPTVTTGEAEPVGDPSSVDSAPVRQPDPEITTTERDAGDATSVTTERRGTPVVTTADRDAGEATSEFVIVAGTPTTTTRTERGTPTRTETPTTTNCKRVNNERGARSVERCERAVLITTTTPTTIVTTTTTPRERVTTTTQPRETVITTTTPVTEVITTTQPRELCTTTTFQTLITTTTTQQTERTVTTTQSTQVTTTTTRVEFRFATGSDVPTSPSTTTTTSTTAGADIVTTVEVAGEPDVDVTTRAGAPESDTVCTATTPIVTTRDGDTTQEESRQVVPALPVVTVTREVIAPLVVETETPGAPIVTTQVRSTGETCFKNPSTAEQRRNACTV